MIKIDKGILYYSSYDEEEIELGKISEGNMINDYFTLGSKSLSIEKYPEIQIAWEKIYPDGKPKPLPQKPEPSIEDYMIELDYRLTKLELGV